MSSLLKSGTVALGALALSCAGVKLPSSLQSVVEPTMTPRATPEKQEVDCDNLKTQPSEEEEYALGGAIALNWVQRGGGLVPQDKNEKLVRYLNVVGKNLGAQSARPNLRWTFGILQSEDTFNAISAPGGYVFVTMKLLRGVENEAQLAGVLAHEIAHVTSRHVLTHYTQTKVSECERAAKIGGVVSGVKQLAGYLPSGVATNLLAHARSGGGPLDLDHHVELLTGFTDTVVKNISEVGFGKDEEFSADEQAARLMVSAGYDPREFTEFLAKIPDGGGVFAHHPSKKDRVKKLVALLKENQGSGTGFSEFAAGTDGLVQPALPAEYGSAMATRPQR
jgi:predicted Zn-dependent protease